MYSNDEIKVLLHYVITTNQDFSNWISMQIKLSQKFLQWLESEKLSK